MRAQVWSELEVDIPADDIWAVYSSPDLPRLIVELMPARFQKIDVLEGDGTQGTVLGITLQPANSGPLTWNEQFVTIDHHTRTKVVRQIKGGFLDIGFNLYENIFTITPKGHNSCIIRATASFDIKEGSESGSSLITANWRMANVIAEYVLQNKANQ
ncbi:S-norcoclaurine synthase [Thalictrum thalictroides]|uniref:S-norcoclaurine synthase n=1 Tax=Thalictrum thalictroides TaxID=46969 RepID=A0A7J6WS69_THATH|nr:S-norcoclaurine synthase [Thalictrum thalictroides]